MAEVVVVHASQSSDEAHHVRAFLDAASGRQGLWRVAEDLTLAPLGPERAAALGEALADRLVLLVSRKVARAFDLGDAPWFELRPVAGVVYAVLPNVTGESKWWPRKKNFERAQAFLLQVVDHFSVRFGQPPGTFYDLLPSVVPTARGRVRLRNLSHIRSLTVHDGAHCVVGPGHEHEFETEGAWSYEWAPALCAEAAAAVVEVLGPAGLDVMTQYTRGLTAKELDALVEPAPLAYDGPPELKAVR